MDFVYLAVIKNKACVLMNFLLVMLSYVVLIYCNSSGKGY